MFGRLIVDVRFPGAFWHASKSSAVYVAMVITNSFGDVGLILLAIEILPHADETTIVATDDPIIFVVDHTEQGVARIVTRWVPATDRFGHGVSSIVYITIGSTYHG